MMKRESRDNHVQFFLTNLFYMFKLKNHLCYGTKNFFENLFNYTTLKNSFILHLTKPPCIPGYANLCDECGVCASGGSLILFFLNEVLKNDHSTRFGIRTRRPVHNHALVRIADIPGSTWFKTGRCYVGTLLPLGSRLSNSLWRTRT